MLNVGINGEEWDVEKIGGLRREVLEVWCKKQIRVKAGIGQVFRLNNQKRLSR
jgi:hypothetical protein